MARRRWWVPICFLAALGAAAAALIFILRIGPSSHGRPIRGAVLILLDTVRADHLSCYGHGRETSPSLDRLAAEGVLFEKTVSFSPWTLPSVANLLSGNRPDNRVFDETLRQSFVEAIRDAGFATAAFTEGGYVSRYFGMDLGFSEYVEEEGAVQLTGPDEAPDPNATGGIERTFGRARNWLARLEDQPFFLFIHTYESHAPYTRRFFTKGLDPGRVGETFSLEQVLLLQKGSLAFDANDLKYLEALYDGGVHESDRHVGEFLRFLDSRGLAESTLVVVTSDHGEELGHHYPSFSGDHGHSLYDDLVLVPLIIRNPAEAYPVKRAARQVRLMDVMPTVAEILGVSVPFSSAGRSLVPVMRGEEETGRISYGGLTKAGPERIFVRGLGYKYIRITGPPPSGSPPPRAASAPGAALRPRDRPGRNEGSGRSETRYRPAHAERLRGDQGVGARPGANRLARENHGRSPAGAAEVARIHLQPVAGVRRTGP